MKMKSPGYSPPLALLLVGLGLAFSPQGCSCDEDGTPGVPAPSATLEIISPQDGDTLGRADDSSATLPGLQVNVGVQSRNMAVGSLLQLTVGSGLQVAAATVGTEGLATFANVTLPEGEEIGLAVSGPGGAQDAITVRVVLETPRLGFVLPLQGAQIGLADDLDPQVEGIQYDVIVRGEWLPSGTPVQLAYDPGRPAAELPLAEDGRVAFRKVTLPAGAAVPLVATALAGALRAEVVVGVAAPATPPEIAFVEPQDGQIFTQEDDLDGDLLNGLQAEITLQATNVENNQQVILTVGGVRFPSAASVVNGTVTFPSVTLPEAPPPTGGIDLVARVANRAGQQAEDAIVVFVGTGACMVQLTPLPGGEGCDVLEDPVPATAAVEVDFQIVTNCERVSLIHNRVRFAEEELEPGVGAVVFYGVPLLQGANLLFAVAEGSGGRRGTSLEQTYIVDTIRPTLGFSAIGGPGEEPTAFSLADDLYRDRPGLQIDLRGWVTDLAAGTPLTITLLGPDGQPVEGLPEVRVRELLDAAGRNTFVIPALTIPASGRYVLRAAALDACNQPGTSPDYPLLVNIDQPTLVITRPAPQSVLLAANDRDPAQIGYQTEFIVEAERVPAGEPITVSCGPRQQQQRSPVGFAPMPQPAPAGPTLVTVPVTLEDGWLSCLAEYAGVNPAASAEVQLLVAGRQPSISFTSPEQLRVRSATVRVTVATVNVEDGQPVTLTINDSLYPQQMVVRSGSASLEQVPLAQGMSNLRVDVQDQAGNPAQASRSVFRDDEAPVVVVLAPADGSVLTRVADVDGDLENGIQVNVQASVDGVEDGEQPTACLSNNDVVLAPCPGQPAAVLGGRVEFPRVSLVPGRNVLLVAVTDGAGNIGTGQATVGLEIDAPTVEVLPLDADNCLAVVEGGVQVTVLSSAADGSPATLLVDDLAVGQGEIRGGQVVFTVNLAPDRVSSLVARVAEPGRDVGISQPMQVRIHSSAGELTFVEPVDGALIGLAAPSTGSPGYMTTVRLLATGIVAGQQATLDVDCPGREPQGTTAQVGPAGNDGVAELAFPDVAFPDDAQCTLVVSSTNCADLSTKTQISITIDRIPPMLEFVQPSDGAVLTFQDDANPQQDGLQTSVVVRVSGVPVGTEVLLRVADRGQLVARSEEEGLTYFRDVTIPDGVGIPLRAEAADAAGNVTTLSILLAEVIGTEPSIAYFAPNRDTSWKAADDLDGSTPGFQQEFVFVTAHLSEGTELKLCSNLAAAGSDCGRAGFRAVATGSVQSDRVTIRRATLAQGTHEVYGEARYGVNRRAESISLRVSIDATVPRLLQLAVTSDRPPLGVLNASEDQVPGGPTLQARVEAAFADDPADPFDQIGDGRMITLFTNNPAPRTQLGRVAVAANALAFPSVNLTEGTHLLSLEGTDVQGNPLPADSPKVQVLVDITPPQLSFSTPLDGQVLLAFDDVDPLAEGLQLDVTLICSGAGVGQPLALSVNEMPRQPPASSREGLVTIPKVTLPEGAVRLAAALSDPAGNSKQASVQVTVDSLPPELAILDPAPGTTLGLAADLDPARGGLQIDVRVQVSGAPAGAPVYVESSSSGQVSDAAVVGANGQAVLRCTLPPGEQELIAWASDELGNEGRSTAVPVTVEIIGCGLFFVAPAGSPVLLGRKDDINGDPQDGAQINVRFAAANLDCDGRQAELLRDGQEWAVTELQAGQASFASLTFLDGTEVLLQGRVADSLTGEKRIRTDLTPPAGSFARPAANPAVLLAADDLDRERAGLQYTFQLNLAGTTKGRITLRSSIDGELLRLPDAQRPQAIGEGLVTLPETSRPLSNGAHQLTATIEDEAGNSASFAIQAEVDVVPPELGELTTEVLDQRLPQIRLSWTAPGDDGEQGGAVSSYDLRYAGYALNRDNLAAACVLPLDEELVAPGQLQEVLAEGPGPDGACRLRLEGSYYFAAVAVDRRGNRSEPSFTGPLEIRFRKKIVSEEATTAFGNFLARLGDVDGDRLPDLGVSSYQDLRAWLILGRQDLAQGSATPIQLPAGPPPTFFGLAIMTVGDVSGDGIGDFAVNAQGSVYLYLGRADGVAAAAPVTRLAVAAGNFPEVSAAGNFDGEGPGDLVIGDFMANGGKGAAWIVLGRPAGEWPAQLDLGLDRQTNDGLRVMALEGNAAGSIGDRMGPLYRFCSGEDSRDDIGLSGFRFSANKGQALVLCGRTLQEMPAGRNLGFADAWLIPSPSAAAGQFGTRLSGGTDLTGDGHPDLVVSAPGIRTLYIYPGNAAGVPALHTSLSGAGLDQYGRFVSQPGDVDGNGLNDLLVATKPSAAQNEPNGLAIIYLAQEVGGQPAFGARDPQLRGEQGSSFGSSLAAPGDMNDDGAPDLAIGSPGNKRVYLFY